MHNGLSTSRTEPVGDGLYQAQQFVNVISSTITNVLSHQNEGFFMVEPALDQFRIFWDAECRIFEIRDYRGVLYWGKARECACGIEGLREFKLTEISEVVREAFGR